MKLFAVLRYRDYEGYDMPIGIFDSLEAAEACAQRQEKITYGSEGIDIEEYELNEER